MVAVAGSLIVGVVRAESPATTQKASPTTQEFVTRSEYEKLKGELEAVKKQMGDQQKQVAKNQDETGQTADEFTKRITAAERSSANLQPGTSKLLITGYTFAGFSDVRRDGSTFSAGLSPIVVWSLTDRIFVEAELELGLNSAGGQSSTDVNLEYADINYIVNDYATIRAGKFLTPFGQFPERLHPAWINKLPKFPLAFDEDAGLVPFSSLGIEVRGAAALFGSSKVDYALYASNGLSLVTDDPAAAGSLDFGNYKDLNHNKAIGGRIGFLPVPELEIGYSFQIGQVSPAGFYKDVDSFLQGVDMSYSHMYRSLGGTIDARAEWVWSHVGTATFDRSGALGLGPLSYRNDRNGGYFQLAYRPTLASSDILRNVEFVGRYDIIHYPSAAPGVTSDQRATLGIDYWLGPSTVIKAAYVFDDPKAGPRHNGVFIQAAVGF
jgi:hypothetical protein